MLLSCQNVGIDTLKKWNIKSSDNFVLLLLWSFENKNNKCFMSIDTIAEYLNESKSTINRIIKDLKNKGFIYCKGKEKALSEKGIRYCQEVFTYPKQKKNNGNKAIVPKWYGDYRKEVDKPQEQEPVNLEEAKKAVEWLEQNNCI